MQWHLLSKAYSNDSCTNSKTELIQNTSEITVHFHKAHWVGYLYYRLHQKKKKLTVLIYTVQAQNEAEKQAEGCALTFISQSQN